MQLPKFPTGADKPSWASLFGAVPLVYVFWDPYQRHAPWQEWFWTGLAFLAFACLATLGAIYWSRKLIMRRIVAAMAVIALAFTAYRPSGVTYFIYVAAFGPLAVGGHLGASAAIIGATVVVTLVQWWLLWPHSWMPYIVAIEAVLIGAAITVVARQQASVRHSLRSAERERIARDLHDILGHSLSVITMKAELAGRLFQIDPNRARAEIVDVERISRKALAEVREAITGYRTGDLPSEFERAKATLLTAGLEVEARCEAAGIPVSHERVLGLVLREAVTNIVRHARATRCLLKLERDGDVFRMEVRDDGRGGAAQEGNGMRGIRERVAAIGGQVHWRFALGTELTVTVPAVPGDTE